MSMLRPLGSARQSRGFSLAHPAIDWPAPVGTPVRAAEGGIVVAAGADSALPFSRDRSAGGGGIIVTVDHGGGVQTLYAHLSAVAVAIGSQVSRGGVIGFSGATGTVTGPHLHFMVWINGKAVDPAPYLEGAGLPTGPAVPMVDRTMPDTYQATTGLRVRAVILEWLTSTWRGDVGKKTWGEIANSTILHWPEGGEPHQLRKAVTELGWTQRVVTAADFAVLADKLVGLPGEEPPWALVANAIGELPEKLGSLLLLGALLALAIIGLKLLARG